jgi:hypothetical protein
MKTLHISQIGSAAASFILSGALLGACATSGTAPHNMTAGQHEAAAKADDKLAAQEQAQANHPQGSPVKPRTDSPAAVAECAGYTSGCYVGWDSSKNTTDKSRKEAEEHRKLAEKHRAASLALREAEQRFCFGISATDRDSSPFYHREDIMSVRILNERPEVYEQELGTLVPNGASIAFRAVPGMTAEWLQRTVDCHLARNAVVGDPDHSMSFCPLAAPHAAAIVRSTGKGFDVEIRSSNLESIKEIIRRAQALKPGA